MFSNPIARHVALAIVIKVALIAALIYLFWPVPAPAPPPLVPAATAPNR